MKLSESSTLSHTYGFRHSSLIVSFMVLDPFPGAGGALGGARVAVALGSEVRGSITVHFRFFPLLSIWLVAVSLVCRFLPVI